MQWCEEKKSKIVGQRGLITAINYLENMYGFFIIDVDFVSVTELKSKGI